MRPFTATVRVEISTGGKSGPTIENWLSRTVVFVAKNKGELMDMLESTSLRVAGECCGVFSDCFEKKEDVA